MKSVTVKGILGGTMTGLSFLLGEWNQTLNALVILLIIDYSTGLLAACYHNSINSKTGIKGIIKKVLYLSVVAVANIIDYAIKAGGFVREMTIFFIIANEAISILENSAKCGLPLPKFLVEKLEQLKDDSDNGRA